MAVRTVTCVAPDCGGRAMAGGAFCLRCSAAPAVQRGGWLSAARRRRQQVMGSSSPNDLELEAPYEPSCIAPKLWVGGRPPLDRTLPHFGVLLLCAQEIQPPRAQVAFRGRIVHCPLPDGDLTRQEINRVLAAGQLVATELVAGKTVIVTCAKGINRSALVATLGLGLATRLSANDLMELVRAKRDPQCLCNPFFQQLLHRYIGAGRRAPIGALPPAP